MSIKTEFDNKFRGMNLDPYQYQRKIQAYALEKESFFLGTVSSTNTSPVIGKAKIGTAKIQ